jgi:hypothetical protein
MTSLCQGASEPVVKDGDYITLVYPLAGACSGGCRARRGDVAMDRARHRHVLHRRMCGPSWGEPEVRDRGGLGVWGVSGCACGCAGGLPATGG